MVELWGKQMVLEARALLRASSIEKAAKILAENHGTDREETAKWIRDIYGEARTREEVKRAYKTWLRTHGQARSEKIKELLLQGRSYREIERQFGIARKRAGMSKHLSSLSPDERKRMILNRLIRKAGLKTTQEELEATLHATIEDSRDAKLKVIGISREHLENLLKKLPEFKLTKKQKLLRQLGRLHEAGEPVHNTGYMAALHASTYDRARYHFGNYWAALRAIGIKAKPTNQKKTQPLVTATPLTERESSILRLRLLGASLRKIAGIHGKTLVDVKESIQAIQAKVKPQTSLAYRLRNMAEIEHELEKTEREAAKPPQQEVFERFVAGQPIDQISREVGLLPKQVARHFRGLGREQKIEILRAAQARVKLRKK